MKTVEAAPVLVGMVICAVAEVLPLPAAAADLDVDVYAAESGEGRKQANDRFVRAPVGRNFYGSALAGSNFEPGSPLGGFSAYAGRLPMLFGLGRNADAWLAGIGSSPAASGLTDASHFTLGYTWRKLEVEGSAFTVGRDDSASAIKRDLSLLDATSSRLSYHPTPAWTLQLSRGNLSNLDQLEAGEDLRRTAVSATYRSQFAQGDWRTTLAWGRNVRRTTGSSVGYLLESTLRLTGGHALFGRLERERSNEAGAPGENLARQMYRTNRLTLGYYLDLSGSNTFRYDVGALLTRHFSAPAPGAAYGKDPATAMVFVRLWLP
jgi:hypothetical protein